MFSKYRVTSNRYLRVIGLQKFFGQIFVGGTMSRWEKRGMVVASTNLEYSRRGPRMVFWLTAREHRSSTEFRACMTFAELAGSGWI